MDGFELDMRQSCFDQQRNIAPFFVEKDFELAHALHDAVCRRRNKRGVSWTRSADPILASTRTYELEFHPGLMPEFAASQDTLLLHLLANTGNIWKKFLVQEEFLPVRNVRVRLRLPRDRGAKSVTLMWSGANPPWSARDGWVEVTVPQVRIYEVIKVDLA